MTGTKKQPKAAPLPGTVAPILAPLAPPAAPPAARQASYRERERKRHDQNAQIANEAMGLVYTVRTMQEMGATLAGVTDTTDEVALLKSLRGVLAQLADPFCNIDDVVLWSRATAAPSKGTAKARRSRERVGK